ncbi:hypothetical protein EV421DRAFT_1738858 [Armillaria borealis]|uniref:Uncharacterized protein n=1 Tax=Armillaria borealis TaxID=47425 RepID=A0AA39J8X3_9AGAR|nr:hypothetical protein EV421DRAFT_1738858 [Armillaria borealis]
MRVCEFGVVPVFARRNVTMYILNFYMHIQFHRLHTQVLMELRTSCVVFITSTGKQIKDLWSEPWRGRRQLYPPFHPNRLLTISKALPPDSTELLSYPPCTHMYILVQTPENDNLSRNGRCEAFDSKVASVIFTTTDTFTETEWKLTKYLSEGEKHQKQNGYCAGSVCGRKEETLREEDDMGTLGLGVKGGKGDNMEKRQK